MKKFVIIGKSSAGKSTFKDYLISIGYKSSISHTTRKPRLGEVNGVDYHFITDEEFSNINFLEKEHIFDLSLGLLKYGLTYEEFEKTDIIVTTPTAIESYVKLGLRDELFIIYLDVPSDVRFKRGLDRGDTPEFMIKRSITDEQKFRNFTDYDIRIELNSNKNFTDFFKIIKNK